MALTDPELDLLRELLEDDPTDEAFLQVGEELVRRALWAEAVGVLAAGLEGVDDPKGWTLLARAALEVGHYDLALAALSKIDTDPNRSPGNAQLLILALERSGRSADAASQVEAYLQVDPHDVVVTSALERLSAPPPQANQRASDPFLTVDRAERYVVVGRPDRAVRLYRRILFHHPGDSALLARLRQLQAEQTDWAQDDLSDELSHPAEAPPDLDMPAPKLSPVARGDNESTDTSAVPTLRPGDLPGSVRGYVSGARSVGAPERPSEPVGADAASSRSPTETPDDPTDPDEEDTDMHPIEADGTIARTARKVSRKRRRSLIQR